MSFPIWLSYRLKTLEDCGSGGGRILSGNKSLVRFICILKLKNGQCIMHCAHNGWWYSKCQLSQFLTVLMCACNINKLYRMAAKTRILKVQKEAHLQNRWVLCYNISMGCIFSTQTTSLQPLWTTICIYWAPSGIYCRLQILLSLS